MLRMTESEHNNREQAMRQLRGQALRVRVAQTYDSSSSRRAREFHQSRALRATNVETGSTGAVLDGHLDQFIEASLKWALYGLSQRPHSFEVQLWHEIKTTTGLNDGRRI